jgi:hypothetical protein
MYVYIYIGFHRLLHTALVLVPLGFGRRGGVDVGGGGGGVGGWVGVGGEDGAQGCQVVLLDVLPHEVFVDPVFPIYYIVNILICPCTVILYSKYTEVLTFVAT